MNLSHHAPTSLHDDTWINSYIREMGEKPFFKYANKVHYELSNMDVGQTMNIVEWAVPENYDKFIKIVCCFISESKCCYSINKEHTIIKRHFKDAREMDKTLALLDRIRREKIAERDGNTIGGATGGTEAISAPKP